MTANDADDIKYMRLALKEAQAAYEADEIPIGAVIVNDGTVIARAHNLTETLHDVTAHAEMLAFTSASEYLGAKYLTGCTLYVTIEPCFMCAGAAGWTQISRIVYGGSDPRRGFEQCGNILLHPKTNVTKGVLKDECEQLMKRFFKNKRQ